MGGRFENPHPWRTMLAVLGFALVASMLLQRLFSPLGDVMLRLVEGRAAVVTGTITPELALDDGRTVYPLSDPAKARQYAGRTVRARGILHAKTGIFDIKTIELVLPPHSHLDRSRTRP